MQLQSIHQSYSFSLTKWTPRDYPKRRARAQVDSFEKKCTFCCLSTSKLGTFTYKNFLVSPPCCFCREYFWTSRAKADGENLVPKHAHRMSSRGSRFVFHALSLSRTEVIWLVNAEVGHFVLRESSFNMTRWGGGGGGGDEDIEVGLRKFLDTRKGASEKIRWGSENLYTSKPTGGGWGEGGS